MATITIYLLLLIATTIYAFILAIVRKYLEPDLTWLEVVIGVTLCLIAPYADARANGPLSGALYEQRVWLAFVVGGAPIVIWQIGQSIRARLHVERRITRGRHDNSPDRTAALASERRSQPETDD